MCMAVPMRYCNKIIVNIVTMTLYIAMTEIDGQFRTSDDAPDRPLHVCYEL